MKKLIFSFLLTTFLAGSLFSQNDETLFGQNGLRLTGAWGGWKSGITTFDDDYAYTRGGFGGLEFGKSLFLGWGGFKTSDKFEFGQDNKNDFDMHYTGLMLGYAPGAEKVVHPQIMLMVAGGETTFEKNDDRIFVIQPSAGIEVNVFRWFRLGLDGGYRFVTNTDLPGLSDKDLSNFYGELKFKFGYSWGN